MTRVVLFIAGLCFTLACTDEAGTHKALQMHGFSKIETTGYSPFSCGNDDAFSTGFRALNPTGQVVEGTVCCGMWGKGCTVRF